MVLKASILLFWILSFVYAAPAIVTVYQTQYVGETVTEVSPTSAPVATPASHAVVAATSQAEAAAASSSSSGFSLSSFLNNDFLSSWLSYFNIGGSSSSSPSTSSAATTSSYSAVVPTSVATSLQSYVTPTSSAQTSSTKTSSTKTSSTQASASSSSAPNGDIYAEMADDSRVDVEWATAMLDAHNKYRAIHQVGDLSWSDAAFKYAQNVADNYDCLGILTHTHGQYGENLSCGYDKDTSGLEAWYEEVADYNWVSQNTYDHFTQMVWKSSTSVGCAYKDCSSNNWGYYAICSYAPHGNVIGKNAQNVFPAIS